MCYTFRAACICWIAHPITLDLQGSLHTLHLLSPVYQRVSTTRYATRRAITDTQMRHWYRRQERCCARACDYHQGCVEVSMHTWMFWGAEQTCIGEEGLHMQSQPNPSHNLILSHNRMPSHNPPVTADTRYHNLAPSHTPRQWHCVASVLAPTLKCVPSVTVSTTSTQMIAVAMPNDTYLLRSISGPGRSICVIHARGA